MPPSRRWRDELWGLTEEPAVIIYNRDLIDPADVPRDRFALLDLMRREPEMLRGKIATYDIEQSGLGYLFAYSDSLEATTFGALLEGFARTDAVATCCSAEIINGVADGTYALAYNVLGSYVANGVHSTVGLILPEDYTLFLSRGFMIPKRAQNPQAATRLLDFLLSPEGQTQIKQAGLTFPQDAGDTGLIPSARRFITLSPALLVPLDAQKLDRFAEFWSSNFVSPSALQ
ncbi:MAG: extracellular solute-binding protein [Pseudomonadota bacterium]|nr:extracellular solute-binding protein [Pseudomonadota bacterium]